MTKFKFSLFNFYFQIFFQINSNKNFPVFLIIFFVSIFKINKVVCCHYLTWNIFCKLPLVQTCEPVANDE